jgi:hypothetical protein
MKDTIIQKIVAKKMAKIAHGGANQALCCGWGPICR